MTTTAGGDAICPTLPYIPYGLKQPLKLEWQAWASAVGRLSGRSGRPSRPCSAAGRWHWPSKKMRY